MPNGPLRRAQLIAPFGVGSMVVVRGGISLVATGLDHWYETSSDKTTIDPEDFYVEEWRLQELLGVDHFQLPPDYRDRKSGNDLNVGLTIPFFRFPQWHFCATCNLLHEVPLSQRGKIKCPECLKKSKNRYMFQVPFVAVCAKGHLQDFPWREWVHHSPRPTCQQSIRLISTGSATLAGQFVQCDCGARRSLASITEASSDGTKTHLSSHLSDDGPYCCQGRKIWLGADAIEPCTSHLRGSLRSASNVYFAHVLNAVYLPRSGAHAPAELVALLEAPPLSTVINILKDLPSPIVENLKKMQPRLLQDYSYDQVEEAVEIVLSGKKAGADQPENEALSYEEREARFRQDEFEVLRTSRDDNLLSIKQSDLSEYKSSVAQYFSRIMLVERLRETRVLAGFSRIYPENDQTIEDRIGMLWSHMPTGKDSWLPAYMVYGEGIYLELDEARLKAWEARNDVKERIDIIIRNYEKARRERRLRPRTIEPRLILLHTFAHLLINRLTFECGYSSASLRERLYVSSSSKPPMGGVLIYTAAGDAEGTMGGLVRMGKPGYIEPVIQRALENAVWCSADPVCMEIGSQSGQGPDSCNLAACHSCTLVPETACEEFNRFLDRATVIGEHSDPSIGYFDLEKM